jgi:uncharacterized membrane protein
MSTEQFRARLIASCVIMVIVSLPLVFEIIPPNGVYGFRVPATRSNPAIWYAANAFMGWALIVAAAISATLQVMLPVTAERWRLWAAFIVPVLAAVAASFAYLGRLHG